MFRFFLYLLLIFLSVHPIPLLSQSSLLSSDVLVTMDDGVQLEATIRMPLRTTPAAGYPGVVLIHGYGGDKDESYIVQVATILALNGYASLAYSVRGQGKSGGESTTMGDREKNDLYEVIEYFRQTTGIDGTRLGVVGGSQGGIHSWMAAVYNMPGVKAIAPSLATPHFALDLIPNGCVKVGLYHEMTLGSIHYSPDRDRVKNFIIADLYDSVASYVRERDLERYIDSVRIPVVQGLGWADVLFPANAGIRAAANLTARHVPIWSYYGTNGHGEPVNTGEFLFYIIESISWFNRWLMDSTLEGASESRVFYADDRPLWPHHVTDVWPPQPSGTLRLYLNGGTLSSAPPVSADSAVFSVAYDSTYTPSMAWNDGYSGPSFVAHITGTPARLMSGPVVDSMEVTGIPAIHLVLSSRSPEYQAHLRLYDVERSDTGFVWRLIGRGTFGVRNSTSTLPTQYDFECNALSHFFPSGHRIGIEITSLDMLSADSAFTIPTFRSTSATLHSSPGRISSIDLPLAGSGAIASSPGVSVPDDFVLNQNYPNPFNASTTITFDVPARSYVTVELFDILGRKVTSLLNGPVDAGPHTIFFDGTDLATGIYYYRLSIAGSSRSRKMVLLK